MELFQQIESGKLRCVKNGGTLRKSASELIADDGTRYIMIDGKVPVLLKNQEMIDAMLAKNSAMESEYRRPSFYHRLRKKLYKDYSSRQFHRVFDRTIRNIPAEQLVLSIGGGPIRDCAHMTTLNIGAFENVDIVGDALELPYHDNSVDAIYHSAVLEHVRDPIRAVREMQRVLKPGAKVLSVIPFMQPYHGYPDHYQNYTISGHEYLYSSNGFTVLESGACLGPVVAMMTMNARFFLEYLPRGLNQIAGRSVQALGILLRPLDRLLENHPNRHVIASATFVLAEKTV